MRSLILALVVSAAFVAPDVRGQTTGVPFINDLTVTCAGCGIGTSACWPPSTVGGPGGVSGSTSCTPLYFDLSVAGTFTIAVTTAPGAQVIILIDPCPCVPCFLPLPIFCPGAIFIPFTACGGTSNQSVDIDLTCAWSILVQGNASTAGLYTFTFPLGPLPPNTCIRASTQAAIITNAFACGGPLIVSQAYDLNLGS